MYICIIGILYKELIFKIVFINDLKKIIIVANY